MAFYSSSPLSGLIVTQNKVSKCYKGFVTLADTDFHIQLIVPKDCSMGKSSISGCGKFVEVFNENRDIIISQLQQSADVNTFWKELINIVELHTSKQKRLCSSLLPSLCCDSSMCIVANNYDVLLEIEDIGWKSVVNVDDSFSQVTLVAADSRNREHHIHIRINKHYPTEPPVCTTDLPGDFNFSWSKECRLRHVYTTFTDALMEYCDVWDELDEVDAQCWVVDPEQSARPRSALYRRIVIGPHASLYLVLYHREPRSLPQYRFIGAHNAIRDVKSRFESNLHNWDGCSLSVVDNLRALLSIHLPSPHTTDKKEYSLDCGICLQCSYEEENEEQDEGSVEGSSVKRARFAAQLVDINCDNERCMKPYHTACLVKWLRSLTSTRTSFNTLFGDCPYCKSGIRVTCK